MKIQINHRYTNAVLFECDVVDNDTRPMRTALEKAVVARATLAGANLAGAYLAGANLAGAYLARANLTRANLTRANLTRANLAGANLADANLADANLADANLTGANLTRANLTRANLTRANLTRANLTRANLAGAKGLPVIPVVANLDARILEAIGDDPARLDMSTWHTCETTHCRAGWAVTLAGVEGKTLEDCVGPEQAGRLIYQASTGRIPDFFADNETALADIKRCAANK